MNRITSTKGDIDFNFTDNNVIKKISWWINWHNLNWLVDVSLLLVWIMQIKRNTQLFQPVLRIKLQRDVDCILLNNALSETEQDEDDPYADFKIPDDLMW